VVDADEYIEKAITLSVEVPMLGAQDARRLLETATAHPFSDAECDAIITVLGSTPRRLKRFAGLCELWLEVAAKLRDEEPKLQLRFSPLDAANRPLFLKLSLLSYLNTGLFKQMQRDPGLAGRLQGLANQYIVNGEPTSDFQQKVNAAVASEPPAVVQAVLDSAIWRALAQSPLLPTDNKRMDIAMRWFRSV